MPEQQSTDDFGNQSSKDFQPNLENGIDRQQKAAILVSLLLQDGVDMSLSRVPSDLQTDLTHQMAQLRLVDQQTLDSVVHEFTNELSSIGLSITGGLEQTLTLLDGKIDKGTINQLRKDAGVQLVANPWARLTALERNNLLQIVQNETVEVSAVLLSKLDVEKAAELLTKIPGTLARSISYAISMTDDITFDAIERIGQSLIAQLDNRPDRVFDKSPAERVALILTVAAPKIRKEVLVGLGKANPEFAELVRTSLFIFDDIATRVSAKDIPQVIKNIDYEQLVKALAHAKADGSSETVEFIFSSLPKRMGESLLEDIQSGQEFDTEDGDRAINSLISGLQAMIEKGELKLL